MQEDEPNVCDKHIKYPLIMFLKPQNIPQLISHNDLKPLGLFIQPALHLFLCASCSVALTLSSIHNHISSHHKNLIQNIDDTKLSKLAQEFGILPELPMISGPIMEVYGLPLFSNCTKCPQCGKIYGKDSLYMHYARSHPNIPIPNPHSLATCSAQQLDRGAHKSLFCVNVVPKQVATTPFMTIVEDLRNERDTIIQKYIPNNVDARAVSPWLLSTGWHAHVARYEMDELIHLVKVPKNENHLDKLPKAILILLEKGHGYLGQTSEIILQKLNSADPAKDGSVFF